MDEHGYDELTPEQMRAMEEELDRLVAENGHYEFTLADLIWNRACDGGGAAPHKGDRALAALLRAHGLTMNGSVLHAVECLSSSDLSAAVDGYRFFGLDAVGELLCRARRIWEAGEDLPSQESVLDGQYADLVPDDSFLVRRFEQHLSSNPLDFAPLADS